MKCEDRVVRRALRALASAQAAVPWYAGDFAPVRTDQIAELLNRFTCRDILLPFASQSTTAMVLPPVKGVYPILIDQRASRVDRQLAVRHELAHVISGDVDEATFLSDTDVMSEPERVADLFALADLIPGWMLHLLRKQRRSWSGVWRSVRHGVEMYGTGWTDVRIEDRTRLRVHLFRTAGV